MKFLHPMLFILITTLLVSTLQLGADDTKVVRKLTVGSVLPTFRATDQHERPVDVKAGSKYVLVSFEMSVAKDANRQLEKLGADFLPTRRAIFIANIHGMPAIGRVFAMPKMRRYPHQIILADEKDLLDPFPQKEGMVTLLTLDAKGTIEAIAYWNPAKQSIRNLLR